MKSLPPIIERKLETVLMHNKAAGLRPGGCLCYLFQ